MVDTDVETVCRSLVGVPGTDSWKPRVAATCLLQGQADHLNPWGSNATQLDSRWIDSMPSTVDSMHKV